MTIFLTALSLAFFATNSLLARAALRLGEIDAATFTAARLLAGAVTLAVVAALRGKAPWKQGSNQAATILFLYAIAFSCAYQLLEAGTGALILFATVQITMLSMSIVVGHHPGPREWIGIGLAFGGLVYLVFPGLAAPSPLGAVLMVIAGAFWACYTVLGNFFESPVDATCGNFARVVPWAALLLLLWVIPGAQRLWGGSKLHASTMGLALAAVSGALTSGLGYIVWYSVLRNLSITRAAIVQLTVPVIAALAGVIVLGERFTWRLGVATVAILGGVAVALTAKGEGAK